MSFTLPPLPYAPESLEPHIDAATMVIHHDKHHNAYVTNLNTAVASDATLASKSLEDLIKHIHHLPESVRTAIRNNGGGHWNHSFFWEILSPVETKLSPELEAKIISDFGSVEAMKEQFSKAAISRFGSGWAWVNKAEDGKLFISSTPNQDNPLMDVAEQKGTPILGLDVWEHAYYLKYQNRRPDYIGAFWNVVNWNKVSQHLGK
jgi:Fe-Mn family superoxide dismutase